VLLLACELPEHADSASVNPTKNAATVDPDFNLVWPSPITAASNQVVEAGQGRVSTLPCLLLGRSAPDRVGGNPEQHEDRAGQES
jgi:hypothetical protein